MQLKLEEVRCWQEITMRGTVCRAIKRRNPDCSDPDCVLLTQEYDAVQYAILLVILGHRSLHGTNEA